MGPAGRADPAPKAGADEGVPQKPPLLYAPAISVPTYTRPVPRNAARNVRSPMTPARATDPWLRLEFLFAIDGPTKVVEYELP
jgi:hypothetical protein